MVYPPANGNPGIIPPWLTPSEPIRPCLTPPSLECDPDPIQTPPPYEATSKQEDAPRIHMCTWTEHWPKTGAECSV